MVSLVIVRTPQTGEVAVTAGKDAKICLFELRGGFEAYCAAAGACLESAARNPRARFAVCMGAAPGDGGPKRAEAGRAHPDFMPHSFVPTLLSQIGNSIQVKAQLNHRNQSSVIIFVS